MEIIYNHRQGSQAEKPLEVDTESSRTTVYLRKNIQRVEIETESGTIEMWEYDEAELTRNEYAYYLSGLNEGNIKAITPYTDEKTAYIGDTSLTFMTDKPGNLTIYGLEEYHADRLTDRIILTFPERQEVTKVTISIL